VSEHLLYLLRHGETEWSATGRHTGRTDVPLNAHGEEQARALRGLDGLRRPTVLCSPRRRALRTAELAGLPITEVTGELAEWDYGDYEGVTTDEIRKTVPGWTMWTHPVPGGESAEQVSERADAVLERSRKALADGDVVLVGHGHFGRVLVARWLGLPAVSGVHFLLQPGGMAVLGHERGAPQVQGLRGP
jgi:broad specificity phosphatase PhoE